MTERYACMMDSGDNPARRDAHRDELTRNAGTLSSALRSKQMSAT